MALTGMASPVVVDIRDLGGLVGQTLPDGPWVTVDQGMVDRFTDAVGDGEWTKPDSERAAGGLFGATVAHDGYFALSLVTTLCRGQMEVTGVGATLNYGVGCCRFPAPIPIGSLVRARAVVSAVVERADGSVLITRHVVVDIDGEQRPACVADLLRLYVPLATDSDWQHTPSLSHIQEETL